MTTRAPLPTTQELIEELRRICAETVEIPIRTVTADADLVAELGIDSLSHDELVEKALDRYGLSDLAGSVRAGSYLTLRAVADLVQRLDEENGGAPRD